MYPNVSIIIPCKAIDRYTEECIEHCKLLDYQGYEIIVLPDFPDKMIPNVKIITTGPISPGAKRNIGIKNSIGAFCAFIDSDAYPRIDWLTNALEILEDRNIGGVGGPGLTPYEDGFMQKASGYILSSLMAGNLSSRYTAKSCFESDDIHSCNFITRKALLEEAGGWNEKYWPGEDTLLCLALRKLGKKLIESSEVVVYHHRRSLFKAHLKQVSRFGEHRGFFAKRFSANSAKFSYFLPSTLITIFTSGIILSFFFDLLALFTLLGVIVYLNLCLLAAGLEIHNIRLTLLVWLGIILTHFTYGIFFFRGLIKGDLKQ